jgi:hypothetical protein
MYIVENEKTATERAIERFHQMCMKNEKITYEELYKVLTHKDLARVCAHIANEIKTLKLMYEDGEIEAEYSHQISFTH